MKNDYPGISKAIRVNAEYKRNANIHMFQEDIVLGIMPMTGTSKNFLDFKAEFIGDELDNMNALEVCKSFGSDMYENDESYVICNCIENITRSLTWDGIAIYEILFNTEKEKLYFSVVSTVGIYDVPFGLLQIVFKNNESKKIFNFLNSKNTWQLTMPYVLRGKDGFRNILSNLRKFNSSGPKFYFEDLEKGSLSNSFNYMNYRRKIHVFLRRSTLNWGWNLRDLDREEKTEIYHYYQYITFFWAKAILRDYIIDEINDLFKKLEINSKIKVSGIPTPKEILAFRKDMIDGEKSFDDVLKFIYY